MKIDSVEVVNLLGIAAVALAPKASVILVAGPNGGGKSSLYQAIKLALLDDLPRVDWKREAPALIRGGASKASVRVVVDGVERGATIGASGRTRADSCPVEDGPAVWCLSPDLWLTATDDERAQVIRDQAGVRLSADDVIARLTARGLPADMIAATVPMLAAGWEGCLAHAQEQAAQARGAWKQITGETYGAVKAAHWRPAAVGPVPEAPIGHDEAVQAHADAVALHSKLKEAARRAAEAEATRERDKALACGAKALRAEVAKLEPIAEAEAEPDTLECPQCNASLVLAGGKLAPFVPVPRPTVPAAEREKARAALATARRGLAAAEAAAARVSAAAVVGSGPDEADLARAAEAEALTADALRSLSGQHDAHAKAKAAAAAVEGTAARASAAAAAVDGWVKMAEAFGPAGIPSEVMAQAMAPYRRAIAKVGAPAGWPTPEIADTGAVSAWGRPAALLSESERYRVAAVLVAALAVMSGVRLLLMDRADVLEHKARAALLGWLCDLTEAGQIEQAWVFCTLKAPLTAGGPIEAYWIENGGLS